MGLNPMNKVDDAINKILEENEDLFERDSFILIRIQDLARKMHPHYWKHRDKILREIHEWAEQHPIHSEWTDKKGRKYKIGYGQQMCPIYGFFDKKENVFESNNILELIKLREVEKRCQ